MLKIVVSLSAFAALIWLPILIYVFADRKKTAKPNTVTKIAASVSHQRFGKGSVSHFSHYLEGESSVAVKSIRDICEWLLDCTYVPDHELFDHPDLWQHPVDFEAKRQGDCEDHCLWAWRKFHDLGLDAEFVVGKIARNGGGWGDHTWIVLKNGQTEHIIETTAKHMDQFAVPESKAKRFYRPYYSMDTNLRSYAYRQPSKK